jgi:uncharacterized membrane protein YgcG
MVRRTPLLPALRLVLVLFGLGFCSLPALARETILSFHSVVDVEKTGMLHVTETIKVTVEQLQIKRGIYRDFPLTFEGDDGRSHRVDFSIRSIERDGEAEDYHTEAIPGGIRIYIGKPDVYIDRGEHTFQISYDTGRQIRYFSNHDELFWNVTGNGWEFPILEASATVTLPEGVKPEGTVFYTGLIGATGKDARVMSEGNEVFFATTRPLGVSEGLTVGVKFAKGAIAPPSQVDEWRWSLDDRRNPLLAGIGLVLVFAYFSWNWIRVGRDPARGIVVPRWDAPSGLSPALVDYIASKGFSAGGWTAFSASVINLAVKGLITLDDLTSMVTLTKTGKAPDEPLPLGEDLIFRSMSGSLSIAKATGKQLQSLGERFRQAIDRENNGKYHRYNLGVIVLGVLITIACYAGLLFFGNFSEDMLGLFIVPGVLATFVTIFSSFLAPLALSSPNLAQKIFAWFFLGAFWLGIVVVIVVSALQVPTYAKTPEDVLTFAAAAGMIVVALFFSLIMGAATPLGRQLRDGIEGLKLYLTLAEQDRMNMAGAPEMSPKHYETLLPYAVALGVEKPWSRAFQSWLDRAGALADDYQPVWYHGDFDRHRFGDRMAGFTSSLSSTITSSLPPPPKSSSSGFSSGGSSGGGGGGGGGGGW